MIYVVIPVYQVEQYLKTAVESVVYQKGAQIKVILVNDGSTDGSGLICDELAERYPQVHVIHQENAGVSAARNAGIEYALSKATDEDYIAFLDGDDFWLPDFEFCSMDADLIACSSVFCNERGDRFRIAHRFADGFLEGELPWINHGTFASFFYRAGMVRKYRLRFLPGVRGNEDVIFWRQATHCAQSVRLSAKILYAYRHNSASVTHGVQEDFLHIPQAWHDAADWAGSEDMAWRSECRRTCGARLLEAAGVMASRGFTAEQIGYTILQGPLAQHLQELKPEDLAQWQRKDLLLLRQNPEKLIKRYRKNGMLRSLGKSLLRFPPIRYLWELYRFPLRSLQ